jgi:hypothetical protein
MTLCHDGRPLENKFEMLGQNICMELKHCLTLSTGKREIYNLKPL